MIKFTCECGEVYNLADDTLGKTYRCRKCSKVFTVTAGLQGRAQQAPKKAWEAVKILLSDPMSGQQRAAQAMGETGCVEAGLVLCGVYALAEYFFPSTKVPAILGGAQGGQRGFNLLLCDAAPAAALIVGFFLIGKIFGGKASIQRSVLVSGTALLPITALLLLARIASGGNEGLLVGAGLFAACFALLLLYAASVEIHQLSSRKAFFMVPVLILATDYMTNIAVAQLMKW